MNDTRIKADKYTRGIGLMLFCEVFWIMTSALTKHLTEFYPPFQLLFFRNILTVPILYFSLPVIYGSIPLRTNRSFLHVLHGFIGAVGMICLIVGINQTTLSETVTITYAAPLFITVLSIPFLGERVGFRRWSAVIVGFFGVLVVARPDIEIDPIIFILLFGTFCFSVTVIIRRFLSRTEKSAVITFYFVLIGSFIGGVGLYWQWLTPSIIDFGLLIGLGLLAAVTQISLTMAIKETPVSILSPLFYLSLSAAVVIDIVFWNIFPDINTIFGAGIIILAGLFIIYREGNLKIFYIIMKKKNFFDKDSVNVDKNKKI
ncbi:MAG: hypothetical protein CMF70_05465 [Magnetovibrio sp.]|nr:hypothetical protein [Magnetovibrio sp.]